MFQNLHFQYPQALWLLGLIPLFILFFIVNLFWKRKISKRIGEVRLVKELTKSHSRFKSFLKFFLIILVFAAGCIALANPRKPDESSQEARKGIDLIVALDVSNSMLATDVSPDRLQLAKQMVLKLIDHLRNDRSGVVLFAGNSYLQVPLTFDHNSAQMFVAGASPNAIPTQGTAIADALEKSNIAFDRNAERFKSIVLITDGETHDEDALQTVQKLAAKGIMINTVGIGSPQGATIIDTATKAPKTDASGNVIISKLNEQFLQQVASATNGIYIHLTNSDNAVKVLMQQLSNIEKKALSDTSLLNYETFYTWLAIPMLGLLLLEIFIPDRKKIKA